jgi:TolA-binding protein
MLYQMARKHERRYIVAAVVVLTVILVIVALVQSRVEASLAVAQDERPLAEKVGLLEKQNLQLQLQNERLDENQRVQIQDRIGQLELEQRLSQGTASLAEKIADLKEQERLHRIDELREPDGYYWAKHQKNN